MLKGAKRYFFTILAMAACSVHISFPVKSSASSQDNPHEIKNQSDTVFEGAMGPAFKGGVIPRPELPRENERMGQVHEELLYRGGSTPRDQAISEKEMEKYFPVADRQVSYGLLGSCSRSNYAQDRERTNKVLREFSKRDPDSMKALLNTIKTKTSDQALHVAWANADQPGDWGGFYKRNEETDGIVIRDRDYGLEQDLETFTHEAMGHFYTEKKEGLEQFPSFLEDELNARLIAWKVAPSAEGSLSQIQNFMDEYILDPEHPWEYIATPLYGGSYAHELSVEQYLKDPTAIYIERLEGGGRVARTKHRAVESLEHWESHDKSMHSKDRGSFFSNFLEKWRWDRGAKKFEKAVPLYEMKERNEMYKKKFGEDFPRLKEAYQEMGAGYQPKEIDIETEKRLRAFSDEVRQKAQDFYQSHEAIYRVTGKEDWLKKGLADGLTDALSDIGLTSIKSKPYNEEFIRVKALEMNKNGSGHFKDLHSEDLTLPFAVRAP